MLPGQALSLTPLGTGFLAPRNVVKEPLIDYHRGGTAIGDSTDGLRVKDWTAEMVGEDIILSAPGVAPFVALNVPGGAVEMSFAFDQSMRAFFCWYDGVNSRYYWYDSLIPGFTTTTLPANSVHPRMALDDLRPLQTGASDVILAYQRSGALYFRAQRDRFLVEYLLEAAPPEAGATLDQIYMGNTNRFEFRYFRDVGT